MNASRGNIASDHRCCCCKTSAVLRAKFVQQSPLLRCRTSVKSSQAITQQLDLELKSLQGMSAVLPGNVAAKQRILQVVEQLELQHPSSNLFQTGRSSSSPVAELLGDWDLVYANNGTVVTRTGLAQGLVQLAGRLPGFGLKDIVQSLYVDDEHPGCLRSTNQAEFGLGPLGNWRVAIRGSWLPTEQQQQQQQQPGNTVTVVFDEFGVQLTGWIVKLPKPLPEVHVYPSRIRIRLPKSNSKQEQGRPAALWQTTYLDGAYRVGRGNSGNVFLFRRR